MRNINKTIVYPIILVCCIFNGNAAIKIGLNDGWKFCKGDFANASQPTFNDSIWEKVTLPHTWNAADVLDDTVEYYRGSAWYRKWETLTESIANKQVFISFGAAGQFAKLYVNGAYVGQHIGGFSSFSFDITQWVKPGKNLIALWVDNTRNFDIPPIYGDYVVFGGLYRDACLEIKDITHFEVNKYGAVNLKWETPQVSDSKALLRIKGSISKMSNKNQKVKVSTKLLTSEGNVVFEKTQLLTSKTTDFCIETTVENPSLWSPEKPTLYNLVTTLSEAKSGKILDCQYDNVGFRWYRFDAAQGFFLNGKPYKLMGANRHQDWAGKGVALNTAEHIDDVKMLKEMGSNFVRLSHYPHAKAVLEACDRLGLIVALEIPVQNLINETEAYYSNSENMMYEMIHQYYNHPSIILWSYYNEIFIDLWWFKVENKERFVQNTVKLGQRLENIIRKEDPYRISILTGNTSDYELYKSSGLVNIPTVMGWNVYFGWYGNDFNELDKFLDKVHAEIPNQPFFLCEYGAGSDLRINSLEPKRFDFTTEWQDKFLRYYVDAVRKRPFISGSTVWNFIDFQSTYRGDCMPHINNKGLVTSDRKPKDAYYVMKSLLDTALMVRITPSTFTKRAGWPDSVSKNVSYQPITVIGNGETVELYNNNKLIGKQELINGKTIWNVPFVSGKNTLKAISQKGNIRAENTLDIDFMMLNNALSTENLANNGLRINCGSDIFYQDLNQKLWLPDQPYRKGSFGFVDGEPFIYTNWNGSHPATEKNVLGTDEDRLFQSMREKLSEYRLDLPSGEYELTLFFADINSAEKANLNVFNVLINNEMALNQFCPAKEAGVYTLLPKKFSFRIDNEPLTIQFQSTSGISFINAIEICKTK